MANAVQSNFDSRLVLMLPLFTFNKMIFPRMTRKLIIMETGMSLMLLLSIQVHSTKVRLEIIDGILSYWFGDNFFQQFFCGSVRFRLGSGPRFGHFWVNSSFCVLTFLYVFVSNNFINSQHTLIHTHTHPHPHPHPHAHTLSRTSKFGPCLSTNSKIFCIAIFLGFLFKKQVLAEFFVDGY